ncbi:MAG TPA: oligosaccharide flippase family protein [Azospirillaceae bacterium]|nr:oligosaccharide flippase family protein [Azospirillaceae bacterium]
MDLRNRGALAVAFSVGETVGRQLVSLVAFFVLARFLDAEQFGLYAFAFVVYAVTQCLVDDAVGEEIVRRREVDPISLSTAFWSNLLIAVAVAAVMAGAAPIAAALLKAPGLAPLLTAQAGILVIGALGGIHQALLRRELRNRALAVRSWIAVTAGAAAGIGVALLGGGVWSLIAQQLVERTLGTCLLWYSARWRPSLLWSRGEAGAMAGRTAEIVGLRLAMVGSQYIDRGAIMVVLGPSLLGIYSLAARIMDAVSAAFIVATSVALLSVFARLQDDLPRLRATYHGALRLIAAVAFPAFLGLAMLADQLIPLMFGEGWRQAGPILAILALNGAGLLVVQISAAALRATGEIRALVLLYLAGAAANLCAILLAAPGGLAAVASALALRQLLFIPLVVWMVQRRLDVSPGRVYADLAPVLLISGMMMVAVDGVGTGLAPFGPPALVLVGQVVAGMLIYTAATALFRRELLRDARLSLGLLAGRRAAVAAK